MTSYTAHTNKLFVFDWNGTILADTQATLMASNACFEFYNAPPMSMVQYRKTFTFPIIDFYEAGGVSAEAVVRTQAQSNAIFQDTYEALAQHARTRRGARELLTWLNVNDVHCMILSNYVTPKIHAHVKRLRLEPYFKFISGHDCDGTTILHGTTKAGRLRGYMEQHGFVAQNTMIIGDSLEEPDIGHELGLTSISITDGYISTPRLRSANPDYMVHSLRAVKNIVQQNWQI